MPQTTNKEIFDEYIKKSRDYDRKTKKIIHIIIIATGALLLMAIIVMWGYDIRRHHILSRDFSTTIAAASELTGHQFTDLSGCEYQPGKLEFVGRGKKQCFLAAEVTYQASGIDNVNNIMNDISNRIPGTIAESIPLSREESSGRQYTTGGLISFEYSSTKSHCSIYTSVDLQSDGPFMAKMSIGCDDTSWFARNFQGNNSIFSYW